MANEVVNPFDKYDEPAVANPFDKYDTPAVTAPITVYTPGQGDPKMEGGFKTSSGAPMHTMEAYDRGEAPYVTAAVHPDSPLKGKSIDIQVGDKKYPVKLTDTGPGVSTIDIASETSKWATVAPKEFGQAQISPSPTEYFDNPFDKYDQFMPQTFSTDEEVAAAERVGKEHPVFKNAIEAASELVTGMIPKSPRDYAAALYPPLAAFDQAQAVAGGNLSPLPLVGRITEIIDAERTPPGSKERFAAGFKTILDVLMVAGIGKQAQARGITPPIVPPETIAPPKPIGAPVELPIPVRGSGKFRKSYQVDKELGDQMEGIGASRESGALRGEIASRRILDQLSADQEAALGRYLVSRRLKTVNPEHPQILNEAELLKIEADTAIAKALDTYVNEVKPDIEALRKRAGLSEEAAAGKEPEFISLIPKTEELLPQTELAMPTRAARLSRTTKFARQALGFAKEYSTDLRSILGESYSEATRKARVSDFYKTAKRKGLIETEKFEDLPPELAHDLRAATESKLQPSGAYKAWQALQRGATSVALTANPAELMNHMRRQLNLLAAKPPIGRGLLSRLEALVPYIGPKTGAFVRAVMDDMSKPQNMAVLQDIFDAGGGSARSFSSMYELRGAFAKVTGLKWLQKKTHNLLFGIPKGRGVGGWDLRMRVQLEKIRRAAEGNVDPQRIREFANQIGQYGSHPDWIVGALREINPYAATTLPMRLTELKTSVGVSGIKSPTVMKRMMRTLETQLRGTGGTILGLASANYLLSGRWPWENDPGHELDLDTGTKSDDGKTIYAKFRVIAPELSRPVGTVGLPGISRERTAKEPQPLAAFGTALANQGLSLVAGPAQTALLTALSGKVPYLVKAPGRPPELMDVAKTEKGESRALKQVARAATSLNPLGEAVMEKPYEPELNTALRLLERPVLGFGGIRPFGSMFSQSYEKKSSRKRPKRPTRAQIQARERR